MIYDLVMRLSGLVITIAAPFNDKASLLRKGRKDVFRFLKEKAVAEHDVVWVHCASLGEFEQGRPLIEVIREQYPHYKILLTFFSPSGYEVRKNYPLADYICYLPADTLSNARRFVRLTKPAMAFFVKYEFWNNFFGQLKGNGIPLYLVSGIFRPGQLFFRKRFPAEWYRRLLGQVTHFFVQNGESAALLAGIGLTNVTVTGDTRFDRVATIAAGRKELPIVDKFKGDTFMLVAGSSWQPDEEILAACLQSHGNMKMIIAPHEVKEANIKRLTDMLPEKTVLYSEAAAGKDTGEYRVMVIDNIGILSGVYSYADMAYIGGGFGVGIHNTLEAAVYNIPVLFGPNYRKFNEAVELVRRGIAFPVGGKEEFLASVDKLAGNGSLRADIAEKCKIFMAENIGATQRILDNLKMNQTCNE